MFGVNSRAPTYTKTDRAIADRWRNALVDLYPRDMQSGNYGWKPNNALYHAEASVLLKIARSNAGTLRGRVLNVFVENPICYNCKVVLPLLARELGNPTVNIIDLKTGQKTIIANCKIN